jgi:hypothetical protein
MGTKYAFSPTDKLDLVGRLLTVDSILQNGGKSNGNHCDPPPPPPLLSGKTHTMAGSKDGPMRGIIPRAVEQTISQVINMRANGWEVSVTASMVRYKLSCSVSIGLNNPSLLQYIFTD